jgi:hypothetical protein
VYVYTAKHTNIVSEKFKANRKRWKDTVRQVKTSSRGQDGIINLQVEEYEKD